MEEEKQPQAVGDGSRVLEALPRRSGDVSLSHMTTTRLLLDFHRLFAKIRPLKDIEIYGTLSLTRIRNLIIRAETL